MVETGEAREVHHLAVLLGFGCDAVCPYMVLELGNWLRSEQLLDPETTDQAVFDNYSAAMDRGISKGLNFNIMYCKCGRFVKILQLWFASVCRLFDTRVFLDR